MSLRRHIAAAGLALAMLQASGAAAQDRGACGQPAALTAATLPGPLPAPMQVRLLPERGEPRYVDILLTQPSRLRLETNADRDLDPVLVLFDASGNMLGLDDDGGDGLDSLLILDLPAGSYCAQVRVLGVGLPPPGAAVALSIAFGTQAEPTVVTPTGAASCDDPRAPRIDAPMPGSTALRREGTLVAGQRNHYRLVAGPGSGALRIDLGSTDFDTVLAVRNAFGVTVAENDDFPGLGTDSRVDLPPAPGEYCLVVGAFADAGGGTYALALADPDTAALLEQPCGNPALTSDLGRFAPRSGPLGEVGNLSGGAPRDFRLHLASDTELRIDASSSDFDTVLSLHDANGVLLAENDDFPGLGTDSRIVTRLAAGDYCIVVAPYAGDGGGTFRLTLAEPDAPDAAQMVTPEGIDTGSCPDPARVVAALTLAPGMRTLSGTGVVPDQEGAYVALSVEGNLMARIDVASEAFDTMIELFDAADNLLAENDDYPGLGTDSRIEMPLAAGPYCLVVFPFPGSGEGTFTVTAAVLEGGTAPGRPGGLPGGLSGGMGAFFGADAPVDLSVLDIVPDLAGAQRDLGVVAPGTTRRALVRGTGGEWLRFSLETGGEVDIVVQAGGTGGAGTVLHAGNGTRLGEAVPGPDGRARLAATLAPGTYLLGLTAASEAAPGGLRQVSVIGR